MKFSLPTVIAIFCTTTALALPQINNVGDLVERDGEGIDLSQIEIDDVEVDYDPTDFDGLEARAGNTIHCSNNGKIKRVKKEYKGKCHPKNSIGRQAAHNCERPRSGKSYLCVQSNKATCYLSLSIHYSGFSHLHSFSNMQSHVLSITASLPLSMVREMANSGAIDEISNSPNAVRHHIYWNSMRDNKTSKTQKSVLFAIYQTGQHGPQNGYRLCLVHQGYNIVSAKKSDGASDDEIDSLEKDIPQGHEEMVILGQAAALEETE
ncbi:hypothetical protein BDP81DRAFT_472783 [Colletotrichum phormii]|uniref:Uncharacterized protein n=1 Tax=Colletotrichum phormii TaxID=359342 RepID=A0AAI9ZNI9_9PEZI|nr:uncharacterized protein BDP81DRAFT_472783 [Colletotrichum phormii]KAK1635254.1 hypothetical protein BDP81DRAFT_472783 [Colletotrichum phormii]